VRVTVADLGVGNLHSLTRGLAKVGAHVDLARDPRAFLGAEVLILPGVAAFPSASSAVAPVRAELVDRLRSGAPALGICAGLQLLYEASEEGPGRGLGLLPGKVRRLKAARVPHMGWDRVSTAPCPIFMGLQAPSYFYFAHSYAPPADTPGALAWVEGPEGFPCAVRVGNTFDVQFHPEKSHGEGASVLRNFLEFAEAVL
jgi:glutamine amidotransferase